MRFGTRDRAEGPRDFPRSPGGDARVAPWGTWRPGSSGAGCPNSTQRTVSVVADLARAIPRPRLERVVIPGACSALARPTAPRTPRACPLLTDIASETPPRDGPAPVPLPAQDPLRSAVPGRPREEPMPVIMAQVRGRERAHETSTSQRSMPDAPAPLRPRRRPWARSCRRPDPRSSSRPATRTWRRPSAARARPSRVPWSTTARPGTPRSAAPGCVAARGGGGGGGGGWVSGSGHGAAAAATPWPALSHRRRT